MAEGGRDALLDMEKELTCAICTDILYQPLTLLDCLHTFCGSCLKEWFVWQATAAASNHQRKASPYTCPSCRESVRGTKADWRLTTLLEGYLKAEPGRDKTAAEKEEMRKVYKPGDDVIPKVDVRRADSDSEDDRLIDEVRQLSLETMSPESARRRGHRSARGGAERRSHERRTQSPRQQAHLTEANVQRLNRDEPRVEHQPSLRSLLSAGASPVDSHEVQQEILQSILSEGLLDGIDIDNLTPEQEDQLTERIAEAYRRRQRRRDRSNTGHQRERTGHSSRPRTAESERQPAAAESAPAQQGRDRPPISRPHLFEQSSLAPNNRHQRSASGNSQRSVQSTRRSDPRATPPAARSATDLTEQSRTEEGRRERRRRMSANARSVTDPMSQRAEIHRMRAASNGNSNAPPPNVTSPARPLEAVRRQIGPSNTSTWSLPASSGALEPLNTVRPVQSIAAFAPEVAAPATAASAPIVNCNRCGAANIQHALHYHCDKCRSGKFNVCLPCYRNEKGCDYWLGFGARAEQRWSARAQAGGYSFAPEKPHVLTARKYIESPTSQGPALQEGAFCEACSSFADQGYWWCPDCLEGAWGYCDRCVHRGRHCSHPLLAVTHLRNLQQPFADPTRARLMHMPHLKPDSYTLSNLRTDCDICHRAIPMVQDSFHCYRCSDGDYDVCAECYYRLVATGKMAPANGPSGWRRCLQGHRMAVVGYQALPHDVHQRVVRLEPVGGWRHRDDGDGTAPAAPPGPADLALPGRGLAAYNYFLRDAGPDDLAFPKNAEVTEVKEETAEWSSGVYEGKLGLFPSGYVRKLA